MNWKKPPKLTDKIQIQPKPARDGHQHFFLLWSSERRRDGTLVEVWRCTRCPQTKTTIYK